MDDRESNEEPAPEPRNRAERRAQRRGKKAPPPSSDGPVQPSPRHVVVPPRRSNRRGNR